MNGKYLLSAFVLLLTLPTSSLFAQSRTPCNCTIPVITTQPQSVTGVCVQNSLATFTIDAFSNSTMQYQWQLDSVNISNNALYSGCNAPTLIITNPPATLNGRSFRCVVLNCLNIPVASNAASLTVDIPLTDVNADGVTNVADFALLLGLYDGSCTGCREDITQDGQINILDFLRLVGRFNQSCN